MPFKKGQTGNANGRPSDPNVKKLREALRCKLVEDKRIKKLFDALDDLEGKEYIDYYLRIQRDILPPMQAELTEEAKEQSVVSIFEMIDKRLKDEISKKKAS